MEPFMFVQENISRRVKPADEGGSCVCGGQEHGGTVKAARHPNFTSRFTVTEASLMFSLSFCRHSAGRFSLKNNFKVSSTKLKYLTGLLNYLRFSRDVKKHDLCRNTFKYKRKNCKGLN